MWLIVRVSFSMGGLPWLISRSISIFSFLEVEAGSVPRTSLILIVAILIVNNPGHALQHMRRQHLNYIFVFDCHSEFIRNVRAHTILFPCPSLGAADIVILKQFWTHHRGLLNIQRAIACPFSIWSFCVFWSDGVSTGHFIAIIRIPY